MVHELLDEGSRLLRGHVFNVVHVGSDVQVLTGLLVRIDAQSRSYTYHPAAPLMLLDQFVPAEGKLHRVCVFEVLGHCRLPAVEERVVRYQPIEALLHVLGEVVICGTTIGELTMRQQRSIEAVGVAVYLSSTTHPRRREDVC